MVNKITGIYKITNRINDKCYVGGSINITKRFVTHLSGLRNNHHDNPRLQKAWNEHGENSFTFEILLYCDRRDLLFFEQKTLNVTRALDLEYGYNCMSAEIGAPQGSNYEKARKKISDTHKGKIISEKQKQQISKFHKGRKTSEKTKRKMSEKSPHSKAVNINGKQYTTMADASRKLGISRGAIRSRIKKKCFGYVWA